MTNENEIEIEYRVDISDISQFADDMMKLKTLWRVVYYVNGGWYCGFPVNDETQNYMINIYGCDGVSLESHDFFIHDINE